MPLHLQVGNRPPIEQAFVPIAATAPNDDEHQLALAL